MARNLSEEEILKLLFPDGSEDEGEISEDDDEVDDPTVYFSDADSRGSESEGENIFIIYGYQTKLLLE